MKELQGAVAFLVASSASGGAVTVVGPITPHTVLTVVAMASAIQELLGSFVFASLPSMLGHLLNVAIAPLLTTTFVACAKFPPVTPQTVHDLLAQSASICPTWDGFADGIVAWQSAGLGLTFDPPHTNHLPSSTSGSTITPVFPIREQTILWWFSSTSWRWTFASVGIALVNLLRCAETPVTRPTSILGNTSGTPLHTVTSA